NIIALLMIAGGILGHFTQYLAYLGTLTFTMCGIMIADYYFVRRAKYVRDTHKIENWNWAGLITMGVSSSVGFILMATDTFALGFLVSLAISLIIYPILRNMLPEGTWTRFASESAALQEAS